MNRHYALVFAAFAALAVLLSATVALADALVLVKVRGEGAADGRVTLTPLAEDGGDPRSCRTEDGECRIDGVPGGRYRVEFAPSEGEAPPPRTAMIPPSGTVTLFVSAASED